MGISWYLYPIRTFTKKKLKICHSLLNITYLIVNDIDVILRYTLEAVAK